MTPYEGWTDYIPPLHWPRVLAMDVGGATPNVLEWGAQDPESLCVVMYQEVSKVTTDMRELVQLAMPHMKHPTGTDYHFLFKVGDYENRVALDDMGRHGIRFDNAIKTNKNLSVQRLSGYLHPNPKRPFPQWHPSAGKMGSPLMFISPQCSNLIKEIPQQKWKEDKAGASKKDEMDRSVRHDAVDCALYIARALPAPVNIPIPKVKEHEDTRSLMSKLYWEDVKRAKARMNEQASRQKYNPQHTGSGGASWKLQRY